MATHPGWTTVKQAVRHAVPFVTFVLCMFAFALLLPFCVKMLGLPLFIFRDCRGTSGLVIRMAVLLGAAILAQAFMLRRLEEDVRWGTAVTLCGAGTIIGLWLDLGFLLKTVEEVGGVWFDPVPTVLKTLVPIFLANLIVFPIFGGFLTRRGRRTSDERPRPESDSPEQEPKVLMASQSGIALLLDDLDLRTAGEEIVIGPIRSFVVTAVGYLGACVAALAFVVVSWGLSACYSTFLVYGWQTPSLFEETSGCIYYIPHFGPRAYNDIVQWDVRRRRESLIVHLPCIKLDAWDVEGDLLAYAEKSGAGSEQAELRVAHLPTRGRSAPDEGPPSPRTERRFTPGSSKVLFRADEFECLDISPNKERIAGIVSHLESAEKGVSTTYSGFRLFILDLKSGERTMLPTTAPEPYPFGICWLPGSRRIVYSAPTANLHVPPEPLFERLKWVLGAAPYTGALKPTLYVFDPRSDSVQRFGQGTRPTLCVARRTITARVSIFDDDADVLFYSLDENPAPVRARRLPFVGFDTVQASPDGRALLGFLKGPVFLSAGGSCALLDWESPVRRHVLLPDTMEPFSARVWTTCP